MTDLALFWSDQLLSADVAIAGADLATDEGLRTAVIVSLFTDARAHDDDALPDGADRRGWWGDAVADVAGDRTGSRLWLFRRAKNLRTVIEDFRQAVAEALAWLVEDGIARSVEVTAEARDRQTLAFAVEIRRRDGAAERHDFVWEATADAV